MAETEQIPRRRLEWLEGELAAWQRAGLIDEPAARAIHARYGASARSSVIRVLLLLGASLLGVGAIWLVAANVWDGASPLARALLVAAAWLACVAGAELAARRAGRSDRSGADDPARGAAEPEARAPDPGGAAPGSAGAAPAARRAPHGDPFAGAFALLAALVYGGLVFQLAQSLQVPAYEPSLLGAWSLGALAYAYAVRARTALVVGLVAGVGWLVWALAERAEPGVAIVVGLALAGPLALTVAARHERGPLAGFAGPCRESGALLALAALWVAALPAVLPEDPRLPGIVWIAAALVALAAVAALVGGSRLGRAEVAAALLAALAALLLVLLAPEGARDFGREPSAAALTHALVGSALFVVGAVALAVDGALRSSPALTNLAVGAIVVFVAVQSFAVVAPIASGATLFLAVGAVLVLTALVADRGRRRLLGRAAR